MTPLEPVFSQPVPLNESQLIDQFERGEPTLDDWFRRRALALGALLLRNAIARTCRLAQDAVIVGILVQAISENVKLFYKHWGFVETPYNPMTLVARLKDLA